MMTDSRTAKKHLLRAATLLLTVAFFLSLHAGALFFKTTEPHEGKLRIVDRPLETGACGVPPANLIIVAAASPTGAPTPITGGSPAREAAAETTFILAAFAREAASTGAEALPVPIERLVANRTGGAPPA